MKEMIYMPRRGNTVLHTEEKDGYYIGIMSYGTHPCAYVSIPKDHPYYQKHYDDVNVDCHGGLTFSNKHNYIKFNGQEMTLEWAENIQEDCSWIGWDYAHLGDYFCSDRFEEPGDKKWTTEEILQDCYDVIEQLKTVANKIQDVEVVE